MHSSSARQIVSTPAQELLKGFLASEKDRTQKWLARTLDVSQSTISTWLRGLCRPPLWHSMALTFLTGIPIDAWLTDEERKAVAGVSVEAHRIMEEQARDRSARRVEMAADPRQEALPFVEADALDSGVLTPDAPRIGSVFTDGAESVFDGSVALTHEENVEVIAMESVVERVEQESSHA